MLDITKLRYINKSTSIIVDEGLEHYLKRRVLGAATFDALFGAVDMFRRRRIFVEEHENWECDILFVSEWEFRRDQEYLESDNDRKYLGLYFSCHQDYGRSIIKISPEFIIKSAMAWHTANVSLIPRDVYFWIVKYFPTLLTSVVVHELGHFIMDEKRLDRTSRNGRTRLDWEDAVRLAWRSQEWAGEDGEEWKEILSRTRPGCIPAQHSPTSQESLHHHIIEESLCNALILVQRMLPHEMDVMRSFIKESPPGYKAGWLWKLSEVDLLHTMEAWRSHKAELRKLRDEWGNLMSFDAGPASRLSELLVDGYEITSSPNFKRDLAIFVAEQLPKALQIWRTNQAQYDDALSSIEKWLRGMSAYSAWGPPPDWKERWNDIWDNRL